MRPADLLRKRIEASGLSARQFAMKILLRDERTVRRWLAGDSPIPEPVIRFLAASARWEKGSVHHVDGNPHNNDVSNIVIKRGKP